MFAYKDHLFARPGRHHELERATTWMETELRNGTWRTNGRHNHYFLALALTVNRAHVMRLATSGVTLENIARQTGVTPERVQVDLELALARLKTYAAIHTEWLPWWAEYELRVKALQLVAFN